MLQGPFQQAVFVQHCRYAVLTSEPDNFFRIPAKVHVITNGERKTVTGFVTGREWPNGERDMEFRAYTYRRNAHLLP